MQANTISTTASALRNCTRSLCHARKILTGRR